MARSFDIGTGPNYSITSVGAASGIGNGAYTIAVLFNIAAGNNNAGLISFHAGATNAELFIDGNQIFGNGDFAGGQTGVTTGTYWWAAIRKAAGSSVYRYSLRAYNSGSTSHQSGVATHADSGVANTSIRLGDAADRGNGLIAVWAAWDSNLSDGQVAGMFTTAVADVAALSPKAMWLGNQASGSDPINDVTGGGANQTSVNGAVGVGTDPAGYDYSLSVASSLRPTPIVVTGPGPTAASRPIILRGSLQDAPVLTTRPPIVVTGRPPAGAPFVFLGRSSLADVVVAPSTVTPQPIVVTGRPPQAASFVAVSRSSTQDDPVLTTTPRPIVITGAPPQRSAPVLILRSPSLQDLATPGPIVVTGPAPKVGITQPLILRSSLVDPVVVYTATPGPVVVVGTAPQRRGFIYIGRTPLDPGALPDCTVHRPFTGTVSRGATGTVTRPNTGIVARPGCN